MDRPLLEPALQSWLHSLDEQAPALVCAVCHDQCLSACPVFEVTRDGAAYPSRLGALVLAMEHGGAAAAADESTTSILLERCILCRACEDACVHQRRVPRQAADIVRRGRLRMNAAPLRAPTPGSTDPAFQRRIRPLNAVAIDDAEALLWVDPLSWRAYPDALESAHSIAARHGVRAAVIPALLETGAERADLGDWQDAVRCSLTTEVELDALGVGQEQLVVTLDPVVAWRLRELWPRLGRRPRVASSLAEFCASVEPAPLSTHEPDRVVLQASSYEARYLRAGPALVDWLSAVAGRPIAVSSRPAAVEGAGAVLDDETTRALAERAWVDLRASRADYVLVDDAASMLALSPLAQRDKTPIGHWATYAAARFA